MNTIAPVTRNNIFYSENDFNYEMDIVLGYIEEDLGQVVVLYQVDYRKSNVDAIYKETTDNVSYKTPVEIPCIYELQAPVVKAYDKNTQQGTYTVYGNLTLYVPIQVFDKYECDIVKGDYIGVLVDHNKLAYFSVVNDGKLNGANVNHVGAFRPGWKVVTCAPVTDSEFNGDL